jgi:hypothetical protein
MGFSHMERVNQVNLLSAKLLQAGSFLKIVELEKMSGSEDLGDGVTMKWAFQLLSRPRGKRYGKDLYGEGLVGIPYLHNFFL